jgi:hypothetical protein
MDMTRLLTREEPISFKSFHSITIETNIGKKEAKREQAVGNQR